MGNAVIWSQAILKRGPMGGQAMERLGSGLSRQEGPENSSLACSRVPWGRLAWLQRRKHEGDGRTERKAQARDGLVGQGWDLQFYSKV